MPRRFLVLLTLLTAGFLHPFASANEPAPVPVQRTGAFLNDRRGFDTRHAAIYAHDVRLWDTWDGTNGSCFGTLDYGPFVPGPTFDLFVAGFPSSPGETLRLVSPKGTLLLQPTSPPGTHWVRFRWNLPPGWAGLPCHLVADDASSDDGAGWLGVSSPAQPDGQYARSLVESLLQVLISLLLLAPGLALVSCLPRPSPLRSLAVLLLSSALLGYVVFFAYFLSPVFGQSCSYAIYAAAVAVLFIRRRAFLERISQLDFLLPNLLALFVAVLYFSGNFLYGGIESPEGVALSRFLWGMPPDPLLPYWFAKLFVNQSPLHPFFADWLTSDRPPLQAGLYLLVWPFSPSRYDFQVVGIAAQSWVWIGFWFFLRTLQVSRKTTAIVLTVSIFSGFFFLNSAFCWPKLLPAAFLLLAVGLLWESDRNTPPSSAATVFAGACAAFAMLGHGGSAFGLAGIGAAYLIDRRKFGLRTVALGFATLIVLMTPWTLYQKRVDPPGDRLIKYHLAAHQEIDPRSSLTVIREAYHRISWSEVFANKAANFEMLCGSKPWTPLPAVSRYAWNRATGKVTAEAGNALRSELRTSQFLHYLQAPGLFLLGLLGLCWWRRSPAAERSVFRLAGLLFLASSVIWCLLMFGPGSTCTHQSSYFTGTCLFAFVGLAVSFLPIFLSLPLLGIGLTAFYWLWMTGPCPHQPGEITPGCIPGFGAVMLLSSAAVMALLLFAAFFREKAPESPRK